MPKIIGTTLADHRELTRRRLFNALGALLAEEPFDAITMSRIAQKAGVGRTAVYNHFADKEVLLLAYMRQVTTEFTQVLRRRLDEEPDPVRRLRVYLRAHMEMTDRYHLMSGVALRKHMSQENSSHLRDHAGIVGGYCCRSWTTPWPRGRSPRRTPWAWSTSSTPRWRASACPGTRRSGGRRCA